MPGVTELLEGIRNGLLGFDPATATDAQKHDPYYQRILIGSKNLETNLGPPLVVLIANGGEGFMSSEGPGQNVNPPILQSRDITFEAHCWGINYNDAENLADAVYTALHYLVSCGRARIVSEEWPRHGHDVAGEVLVRQFSAKGFSIQRVDLPLPRPITMTPDQTVGFLATATPTNPVDDSGVAGKIDTAIDLDLP